MNVIKKYDAAFKIEVAKMVLDQGVSISKIAKDMEIGEIAVRRFEVSEIT